MDFPEDLLYTKEHEWVKVNGKEGKVGITSYAVEQLGDIVYVELPEKGKKFKQMETFGVVESVKAVSDLYLPLSGEVIDVNGELIENPAILNEDPYGRGWMIKIKIFSEEEKKNLMNAQEYRKYVEEERGK